MSQVAFQKDQSGSILEIGLDKLSLAGEDHAAAVVQARDDGGLGQGKEKMGTTGERSQKWRKGTGVE